MSDPSADPNEAREARLAEIVAGYMDVLARGGSSDRARILAENPDLAVELEDALGASLEVLSHFGDAPRGEQFGKYRLLREVGRGGMGVIYEAWEPDLERRVALKALAAGFSAGPAEVERFRREARLLARLHHGNIVPVFDAGVHEGELFFTMELVEGETLDRMHRRRLNAAEGPCALTGPGGTLDPWLAEAFAGAAEGLHHAHRQGIIHRDVKPSNLILDSQGRLRLLDFGLARLEGDQALTVTGDVLGTPLYMSPEQAGSHHGALDHRTDIYSLGATYYETLTGAPPFLGSDHRDTLGRILTRDPRPLRKVRDSIPRDLETIVLKCLRKDPRHRYASAEALAQDLHRFARDEPIEARAQHPIDVILQRALRRKAMLASIATAFLFFVAVAILMGKFSTDAARERKSAFEKSVLGAVLRMQLAQPGLQDGEADAHTPAREALRELDGAEALFPRSPDVHYHRGRCLQVLGKTGDAVRELDQALACEPGFVPAAILKSALLRTQEGKAADPKELATTRSTADPWARAFLDAHLARLDGRWSQVVEAFTDLLRLEREKGTEVYLGSSAETLFGRGAARMKNGDLLGAFEDFASARARWPDALEPTLLLAETSFLLKAPEKCAEALEELYRSTPGPSRDAVAARIAFVYHRLEGYEAGLAWAERIGDRKSSALKRSDYLRHLGRLDDALAAAKEARDLDPGSSEAQESLAKVLTAQGHAAEGVAAFERAADLDSSSATAHANLALALERLGELDRAASEYRRAIALDPELSNAHRGLGSVLAKQDRLDAATDEFRSAIRLSPRDAVARHNLGNLLCRRQMYAEAVEELAAAVRIHPAEPLSRLNLAYNLQLLGKSREAIEGYREALKLAPNLALAHIHLGELIAKENQPGEALEEHCAALAIDPGLDPSGSMLEQRLVSLRAPGEAALLKEGARASVARALAMLKGSAASETRLRDAVARLESFESAEEARTR